MLSYDIKKEKQIENAIFLFVKKIPFFHISVLNYDIFSLTLRLLYLKYLLEIRQDN